VDARRLNQPVSIDRPTQVRLGDAISGPLLHLVPAAVGSRHAATVLAPPSQPQSSPQPQAPQQHQPRPPQRPQFPPPSRLNPQAQRPHQPPQYVPTSQLPAQPVAPQDNINMTRRADSS